MEGEMSKHTINRLFVGSITAVIAGLVLGFLAVWIAFAGDAFVMSGPDVTGIRSTPFAVAMVALVVAATVAIIGGGIAGLVSWIGALLNTAQLNDKTWFVILLVLGIWNLGIVAMCAYVLAGPDAVREQAGRQAHAV
jgi:hypothetical protein